ncbi:hypothetical protein TNCV_2311971 [Trichonephila clavipes]|nr:hypothetical protein TNCV_2311971 [Trichonephila clavipes]
MYGMGSLRDKESAKILRLLVMKPPPHVGWGRDLTNYLDSRGDPNAAWLEKPLNQTRNDSNKKYEQFIIIKLRTRNSENTS